MGNLFETCNDIKKCCYKNELYLIRDNGEILRKQNPNKRKRPLDEKWTFGKPCKHHGYMKFSSEAVHRIVATAFHGNEPSKNYIVDHIDTNRKNNRPENLRWITKLDNILKNPISMSRIIYMYGSIDDFLANPSRPLNGKLEQNFEWMRSVTKEESENTKNNLMNWFKEGDISKGGQLGEWIYTKLNSDNKSPNIIYKKKSKNPNVPQIIGKNPIQTYYDNLKKGDILFCDSDDIHLVLEKEMWGNEEMRVTAIHDVSEKHIAIFNYFITYNGRFYNHRRSHVFYRKPTEEDRNILDLFSNKRNNLS